MGYELGTSSLRVAASGAESSAANRHLATSIATRVGLSYGKVGLVTTSQPYLSILNAAKGRPRPVFELLLAGRVIAILKQSWVSITASHRNRRSHHCAQIVNNHGLLRKLAVYPARVVAPAVEVQINSHWRALDQEVT